MDAYQNVREEKLPYLQGSSRGGHLFTVIERKPIDWYESEDQGMKMNLTDQVKQIEAERAKVIRKMEALVTEFRRRAPVFQNGSLYLKIKEHHPRCRSCPRALLASSVFYKAAQVDRQIHRKTTHEDAHLSDLELSKCRASYGVRSKGKNGSRKKAKDFKDTRDDEALIEECLI